MTYNVWYEEHQQALRHPALLRVLEACDADVLGLQEVSPDFLAKLEACAWVRGRYRVFADDVDPDFPGTVLLSRKSVATSDLVDLPGNLGRRLVVAELGRLTVAAVHLESMRSRARTRREQLAEIFAYLEGDDDVVLMGDFNFCATSEENAQLDPSFDDVWSSLRPDDPGFTEDTTINRMRLEVTGRHKHVRYDRMLLRTRSGRWAPQDVALIGTEAVGPDHPDVFPSDHFGLVATLQRR